MLERGKLHQVCAVALCYLITKSRLTLGSWYIRLAINLKHLKMKHEAFSLISVCPLELLKCFERNTLLKVRLQLFSEIVRKAAKLQQASQKKRPYVRKTA